MITERISPLALALEGCRFCVGRGVVERRRRTRICTCVYRRVFRACYGRYRELRQQDGEFARRVTLERTSHREGRSGLSVGFKGVEYLADFELVARRTLRDMPLEYEVFWLHCVHRLDWRACLPLIGRNLGQELGRGNFFHAVYRMEQKLGQAFLALRPYSLLPREYFSGWCVHQVAPHHCSVRFGDLCMREALSTAAQRHPDANSCQRPPKTKSLAAHAA